MNRRIFVNIRTAENMNLVTRCKVLHVADSCTCRFLQSVACNAGGCRTLSVFVVKTALSLNYVIMTSKL